MTRVIAAAVGAMFAAAAWAGQPAGVVKIVKGTVALERDSQKRTPVAGERVAVGDRIVTGSDGQIGVTLSDNTLLSAGPNSSLVLDKYAFDATTHGGVLDASVRRGTLAVVSGKIARQSPESVRFRTSNSILGVRGTTFVIDAGSAEER
jgi:hypothetical protein